MEHFREQRFLVSFDASLIPQVFCDVLVIGSGVAGLRAALAASEHVDVLVVAKGSMEESNTTQAQGGIAGAVAPEDTPEAHMADTLAAGQGLCADHVVKQVTDEASQRIEELIQWGANFDEEEGGRLALAREGGHSASRIVHALGDATGRELTSTLLARVRMTPNIQAVENAFVLDLLTVKDQGCVGAILHDKRWGKMIVWAKQTVLASGGGGRMFRETTNASMATGDGTAMAYRAGAELCDLEFYQFHPTALYVAGASRALISEAVRGEGGHLVNARHERFMPKYHERAELAPRDAVSRAIVQEIKETGHTCAYLDMRHIPAEYLATRFPGIRELCLQFDIDITSQLVPIRPAAHYMIGGVKVDLDGRSSVPRLFACGEVACSGLHGANRLGSNSLLEGLVIGSHAGHRAGIAAARDRREPLHPRLRARAAASHRDVIDVGDVRNALRAVTWRSLGIERHRYGIEEAIHMMRFWGRYVMDKEFPDVPGWELQNMLALARLVAEAALMREESRGVHYRTDFPRTDNNTWHTHIVIRHDGPPERRAVEETFPSRRCDE